ncbi:sigma-E factor negative regulatory protein [Kaarinaea lacus]
MTTVSEKDEQVSAFIDDELKQDQHEKVISEICKDQELKYCLERYQMISDSMRNQLPAGIKPGFVDSVMAAIESEPTILAPANLSKKSSFPSMMTRKAAGFAIAASVATIAVIGVQSQYSDESQQVATTMPDNSEFVRMAKENPPPANMQPVITPRSASSGYSTASTTVQQQSIPQLKPSQNFDWKLHQYIVNHSQYANGAGVHDIISSARIVSSSEQKISADQVKR